MVAWADFDGNGEIDALTELRQTVPAFDDEYAEPSPIYTDTTLESYLHFSIDGEWSEPLRPESDRIEAIGDFDGDGATEVVVGTVLLDFSDG